MDASLLMISIGYESTVCVLSAVGDLDMRTAGRFRRCALAALADPPERLVFDLAGVSYLDCAGARALESVARAVPEGCPVAVRAVSPVARRLLGVLDVDLAQVPRSALSPSDQAPGPRHQADARQRLRQLAEDFARIEDKVAVTFARMASTRPHRAAHLTAVSQSAHDFAIRARCWASAPQQQRLVRFSDAPRPSQPGPTAGTGHWPVVSTAAPPGSTVIDVADLLAVRAVIEQAKGILMATYRCGVDEASDLLHKASQGSRVRIHVVAAKVVELAAHGVLS